jgi:hypothetical protein
MRPILFLALICLASVAHAAGNETNTKKKFTQHLQFLIGNYVSESAASPKLTGPYYFLNTAPGQINAWYNSNNGLQWGYTKPTYTPLYSYSIGIDYKVEFTKRLGLRAGFNYYTYSFIQNGKVENGFEEYIINYQQTLFISSLLIPLHIMTYTNLHSGRLVFSAGPDFYFPINSFGNETTDWYQQSLSSPATDIIHEVYSSKIKYHSNGADFFQGGSLGFTVGLGYEKKFAKGIAVEFMPDFRLLNAVPFDFQGLSTHIYQNYIFNMALGLSTYITFY